MKGSSSFPSYRVVPGTLQHRERILIWWRRQFARTPALEEMFDWVPPGQYARPQVVGLLMASSETDPVGTASAGPPGQDSACPAAAAQNAHAASGYRVGQTLRHAVRLTVEPLRTWAGLGAAARCGHDHLTLRSQAARDRAVCPGECPWRRSTAPQVCSQPGRGHNTHPGFLLRQRCIGHRQ